VTPGGRLRSTAGLASVLLALAPAVAWGGGLRFERAFDARGEPASLHFQATFQGRGSAHRLEVWRDGERRVRRRTDDAIETFASHPPEDPEYRLSILDLKRRIHTRVDRTNLVRIGNFTDWFDLTHGLRRPRGAYQLAAAAAPAGAPRPLERCRWYDLSESGRTSHVCWSAANRIPLLIVQEGGDLVWRVDRVDRGPHPAGTFDVHDEGFVRNDANEDIAGD
jgi:hypothetical protein